MLGLRVRFLTFLGYFCYVWGLVILMFGVSFFFTFAGYWFLHSGIRFVTFGVSNFYVWKFVILTIEA